MPFWKRRERFKGPVACSNVVRLGTMCSPGLPTCLFQWELLRFSREALPSLARRFPSLVLLERPRRVEPTRKMNGYCLERRVVEAQSTGNGAFQSLQRFYSGKCACD